MTVIKVDCTGEICPVPLVETHKAVRRSQSGDIIEVTGTHPSSKKDIQVEVKTMGLELIEVKEDKNGVWVIRIRR